jgi:hypothetical protein
LNFFSKLLKQRTSSVLFSNNSTSSASKVFLTGVKLKLPITLPFFFRVVLLKIGIGLVPLLSSSPLWDHFQYHYKQPFSPRIATPGPFLVAHPYY